MERSEFLKLSGLTASGLALSMFNPLSLLGNTNKIQRLYPELETIQIITIDKTDVMWVGWLSGLVVSSLITALGAKIVDKLIDNRDYGGYYYDDDGNGYSGGAPCSIHRANPSQYINTKGIYGYNSTDKRLVVQEINDDNVQFTNMSTVFLSKNNSHIFKIEGPYLAGLCWAANDLSQKYNAETVKSVIIPKQAISSGGHRFDRASCNNIPTKMKTDYGTTEIKYAPNSYGNGGEVTIIAKNGDDRLDWSKLYQFNA